MIIEFQENYIKNIAEAQVKAWQETFKGMLSKEVLDNLIVEEFVENWKNILKQKGRTNNIWINKENQAVGFISFGKPKDRNDLSYFEIYGIYVHPNNWGKGIGSGLMNNALESIRKLQTSSRVILWTMTENRLSCNFYEKTGFSLNGKTRESQRHTDLFEEVQFEITVNN